MKEEKWFDVYTEEKTLYKYSVRATSTQEAKEKIMEGEAEYIESVDAEFISIVDVEESKI